MSGWLRLLFTGVGGQGILSLGRWVGDAAHASGLPVTVRQVHGLSQRGGSVNSSVALGGARNPEIADGMADVLLALEPMEGARLLAKVSRPRTMALVNTRPILPGSLLSSGRPYPPLESLLAPIEGATRTMVALDATGLAEEAGSPRALNVVMLGLLAATGLLPFPGHALLDVIISSGAAFAEVNRRAFRLGEEALGSAEKILTRSTTTTTITTTE